MKSILLKFENENEFWGLSKTKARAEFIEGKNLTWEEFIIYLKKFYNRN